MVINHIMCTSKILTDLYFTKQKIRTKNTFAKVAYSVLLTELRNFVRALMTQSVRLEKGAIEFKNLFNKY